MAGRGRKIGSGYAERSTPLRRPGGINNPSPPDDLSAVQSLIKKINNLNAMKTNPDALSVAVNLFQQICQTGEILSDTVAALHTQALDNSDFCEKVVPVIAALSDFQVTNIIVRDEILRYIQNDFTARGNMFKMQPARFINAVTLLGGLYHKLRIRNQPIFILGDALMEYANLLLNGGDEHLRVLTTQVMLNTPSLLMKPEVAEKYETLQQSLRKAIVTRNLTETEKCWLLLAIDMMATEGAPLPVVIRDFYVATMGDEFSHLEAVLERHMLSPKEKFFETSNGTTNNQTEAKDRFFIPPTPTINNLTKSDVESAGLNSDVLPDIKIEVNQIREKMKATGILSRSRTEEPRGERSEQRFELRSERRIDNDKKNRRWQEGEKLSDDEKIWGLTDRARSHITRDGHDDRFSKDDDFYGIQLPRSTKGLNIREPKKEPRSNFSSGAQRGEESWE